MQVLVANGSKRGGTAGVAEMIGEELESAGVRAAVMPARHVGSIDACAMAATGARGHVTIGGRLEPDTKGFPASAMAKKSAGDWRDRDQIQRWAASIVADMKHSEVIP